MDNIDFDYELEAIATGKFKQSDLLNAISNSQSVMEMADDLGSNDTTLTQITKDVVNPLLEQKKLEDDSFEDTLNELNNIETKQTEDNPEAVNDELTVVQLIKELNVLDIPEEYLNKDDLTDEDLYYLSEYTRKNTKDKVLQELEASITDAYEKELFEYWKNPTKDKQLPEYKALLDDIKYFEDIDISDKENQKELLTFYLKDGLDINNPAHAYRLANVDKDVKAIMESDDAENQSNIARKHIQTTINTKRLEEKQRVIEAKKQAEITQQKQLETSKQWFDSVNNYIEKQSWDKPVKQTIYKELYSEIQLNNETKPLWVAKLDVINQSPDTHIKFIEFLNSFDINSRRFTNNISEQEIKNAAVSKIKSLANKKVKQANSSGRNNYQQNTSRTIIIDPFF